MTFQTLMETLCKHFKVTEHLRTSGNIEALIHLIFRSRSFISPTSSSTEHGTGTENAVFEKDKICYVV